MRRVQPLATQQLTDLARRQARRAEAPCPPAKVMRRSLLTRASQQAHRAHIGYRMR
jgi:hypothetical protein